MILEIDYREISIINILCPELRIKTSDKLYYSGELCFKICNLPIGDFIFKEDDNIMLIIERKSFNDLCASINDNRFREQKQRLVESVSDPSKIVYILEGGKNVPKIYNIPKSTINSAILNLIFKHNYKVIITEDTIDTLANLFLLYNKINSKEFDIKGGIMTLVKKSGKDLFINQLVVISGVSVQVAKKIKEKYINMNELVTAYNNNDKFILSELMITEKRKIGKSLSEKIYNSLFI